MRHHGKTNPSRSKPVTWRDAPWPFVEIWWHDACAPEAAWVHEDDLPETPAHVITRGWLVKDEPDFVLTVGSFISEEDDKWTFGDVCVIPTGMIKKRRVITDGKRGRRR